MIHGPKGSRGRGRQDAVYSGTGARKLRILLYEQVLRGKSWCVVECACVEWEKGGYLCL